MVTTGGPAYLSEPRFSPKSLGKRLLDELAGLPGIIYIVDDVIIHGANTEEHDKNLKALLTKCREKGNKVEQGQTETPRV